MKSISVLRMQNWIFFIFICVFVLSFEGCSSTSPDLPIQSQLIASDDPDPEALKYFMEGQLYINQGNYAMAAVELQNALLIDKNVSTIHLSLADCYWMLKKPKLSIFHMRQAISVEPEDNNMRELLAKRFLALKEIEEAKQVFLRLSVQNPGSVKYIISLAELERLQNNLEKSISYYQQAHHVNPQELSYLEKAVELGLQLRNESLTIDLIQKLISLNPTNVNYIKKMINISFAFENKEKTIWSLKKMIVVSGSPVEFMNQLGILYYNYDDPDSAIAVFTKVMQINPLDLTAPHYLTLIYDENGNILKAEEYAGNLIIQHPDNPIGFADLALLYLNHNNLNKAIETLTPASKKFQSNYMIQFLMGLALNQSGDKLSAIPFYERALVLNPDSRNAMHNLAILYDLILSRTKSDSLYKILIETDTTDAQAFNNFAYSLAERNERLNYALELSRKAVQLVPESAAYLDTMGWILFAIGNNTLALNYIKQSVNIEDHNAIVLEHLGDVYKANNNLSDAKYYWNKAIDLDPGNEQLKKKLSAP